MKERSRLDEISERLSEIAGMLRDPMVDEGRAAELAGEAAELAAEAGSVADDELRTAAGDDAASGQEELL